MCDTNGGMLPSRITAAIGDLIGAPRHPPGPARHPLPERHVLRGGQHRRRGRGGRASTSSAPPTGTASGPATPTSSPSSRTCNSSSGCPSYRTAAWNRRCASRTRIAEIANIAPDTHQAYVGAAAFAHKAGLHASAIKVDPVLYNHVDPSVVGNDMRILVTEMAGRASIELKSRELGLDLAGHPDDAVPGHPARSRTWRPAAGRSRPPTRRSSCWSAASSGEVAPPVHAGVLPGAGRAPRGRRGRVRGDGQGAGTRRAGDRHRRGQRPGQRARRGAAGGAVQALPGAGRVRAGRLQGAHPGGLARHRRDHPGAAWRPPTAPAGTGPPSACTRTSSRRAGTRWSTR